MPINKNAFIRYRVIDSLLRTHQYVKTRQIIDKIWERHDEKVASTTINKDIRDLIDNFHAPIDYCDRKRAYYYPNEVEALFPSIDLQSDEIAALLFYAKTLQQYKQFGVFDDFTSAIDKIVDAVQIKSSQRDVNKPILIQPENLPKFKGSDIIPQIVVGFDSNKKISFEYKKHTSAISTYRVVTPIMLKEYDHLWYLLAQADGEQQVKTFALDRINDLQVTNLDRDQIVNFNPEKYFDHAFGIIVPKADVEEVILEFDDWRGRYLLAAPIHKTQKFIKEENGKIYLSLTVIPFHELYAKILSYGNHVKVISPESLVKRIKELLSETLKKY